MFNAKNDPGGAIVIARELLDVLDGELRYSGFGSRNGHLPGCYQGNWTTKYNPSTGHPDGQPCSERCRRGRGAMERARAFLGVADG